MKLRDELEARIRSMHATNVEEISTQDREGTQEHLAAVSLEDSPIVLRMCQQGYKTSQIAEVCKIQPGHVVAIMAQASYQEGLGPTVKRLTKDPAELCCSISGCLFENPVVAEDGSTYDKKGIEQWLAEQALNRRPSTSPLTGRALTAPVQLNPSQDMASRVLSFKQETVAEVLLIAPFLEKIQAFEALEQLLDRAQVFVMLEQYRDARRKQLFTLLMFRMRMPGRGADTLLEQMADEEFESLMSETTKSEFSALLSRLPAERLPRLCSSTKGDCRDWMNRELAIRVAQDLVTVGALADGRHGLEPHLEVFCHRCVRLLWGLLLQNLKRVGSQEWAEATAVFLVVYLLWVETPVEELDGQILRHALQFLENRQKACFFAKAFFKNDFGISDQSWPPLPAARVVEELASRRSGAQRLQLLVNAHGLFPFDAGIRRQLLSDLGGKILVDDPRCRDATFDEEQDLFVKLALEDEGGIPEDVISKVTLKEEHLQHLRGNHMLLMQQLRQAHRFVDAARVAVVRAQSLARAGDPEEAEAFFLAAYQLDPSNVAAAGGLSDLANRVLRSIRGANGSATSTEPVAAAASSPTSLGNLILRSRLSRLQPCHSTPPSTSKRKRKLNASPS